MNEPIYQTAQQRRDLYTHIINTLNATKEGVSFILEELETTDKLLETRDKVIEATVECPIHGPGCAPHAIHWLHAVKQAMQEFVDHVDRGEVRSKYTYNKFKNLLAGELG